MAARFERLSQSARIASCYWQWVIRSTGSPGSRTAISGETLGKQPWGKKYGEKQLSARISRNLVLLRNHGLIRKMPNQNRYQLTDAGRQWTASLSVALKASTTELMKIAA